MAEQNVRPHLSAFDATLITISLHLLMIVMSEHLFDIQYRNIGTFLKCRYVQGASIELSPPIVVKG